MFFSCLVYWLTFFFLRLVLKCHIDNFSSLELLEDFVKGLDFTKGQIEGLGVWVLSDVGKSIDVIFELFVFKQINYLVDSLASAARFLMNSFIKLGTLCLDSLRLGNITL